MFGLFFFYFVLLLWMWLLTSTEAESSFCKKTLGMFVLSESVVSTSVLMQAEASVWWGNS